MATCANTNAAYYTDNGLLFKKCEAEATQKRKTWRIGDRAKGEDVVMYDDVDLCKICADLSDSTIGVNSDNLPDPPEKEEEDYAEYIC